MSRTKTKRHDLPQPDERGRIRPHVGKRASGGKARFTVGDRDTSPSEAQRRLDVIRSLYERQCARSGIDFWNEWTRRVANRIGAGQSVTDTFLGDIDHPQHMAGCVDQLRAWGIPVTVTEPNGYSKGTRVHRDQVHAVIQELVAGEMAQQIGMRGAVADNVSLPADPLAMAETATFHRTIEAYRSYLKSTGKTDDGGNLVARVNKCRDRLRYFKHALVDMPLWKLDLSQLETIAAYWRNRPMTQKGSRCSKPHAEDMAKEIKRFLKWLDTHPSYRWSKPKGFEDIDWKPIDLPQDVNGEAFQTITKKTYSPEQLAKILRHTDVFGKALIGVCVNCAFGQSEVGQWPTNRILLNTPHPHAGKIGIVASEADSWVVGPRPKTKKYGEHLLWPEVAESVRPFLDGRDVLPITGKGTKWYRSHSREPADQVLQLVDGLDRTSPEGRPNFSVSPFRITA